MVTAVVIINEHSTCIIVEVGRVAPNMINQRRRGPCVPGS